MVVFLFDVEGDLIRGFRSEADLAKAVGCEEAAVDAARKRGSILLLRYYVGAERKLGPIYCNRFTHNPLANLDAGTAAARGEAGRSKVRTVQLEEMRGLALLATGLSYDEYLYGQLGPMVERPLSLFPEPADRGSLQTVDTCRPRLNPLPRFE
jgi:hypothetical protein